MDISLKDISNFSLNFNENDKNKLAKNAVTNTKLKNLIINRDKAQKQNRIFSNKINVKTVPSDQKYSGRCWLFAMCNMVRLQMNKKYGLDDFEFSQSYLAFYDKLERSNFFLHMIIKFKDEPINSRYNTIFLDNPINDGGNWNMILNLVNKYGMVPKSVYNETVHSNDTYDIDEFLNNKLRDYAFFLRSIKKSAESSELKKAVNDCMNEIYKILVIFMGEPPSKFDWEYLDKGKYKIIKDITPQKYYTKYIPVNLNDYILLSHNPIIKYETHFTVNNFNNMKDGKEISYINVSIDDIKKCIKKSIDSNEGVWFGCDVGKYLSKSLGVLDINMINYRYIFDTDIVINKKNRLLYRSSDVTHAMVIRGYDNHTSQKSKCKETNKSMLKKNLELKNLELKNLKQKKSKKKVQKKSYKNKSNNKSCKSNKPVISKNPVTKYLVENSWGKEIKLDENLVMTTEYLDEYLYVIAVNKKYVSNKFVKIQKEKPQRLNLWDPFGYLLF